MPIESPALLARLLKTEEAEDCVIDPDASPVGATIRVLFTGPFAAQESGTGPYDNTRPVAHARAGDVAEVIPEITVLRIDGQNYTANRIEKVDGGNAWRLLILNEIA